MRHLTKRIMACLLAAVLFFETLPITAYAANMSNLSDVGLEIITNEESNLAPGVTMNEIVAFDSNGDRVEMYVTTADSTVDTVSFYANYKDNQNSEYGLQTLSEQVAAIEANYEEPFKVVAGINASYYNTSTGKPTGAFVMEGIDVTTESEGNNYAFFAVLKDGTVMIGDKGTYSDYKGQIKEAIGGYVHIVKDGAVVSGLDKTTKYPRQTIGITADGQVVIMTADGSQVPKTIGLTYQEQAEVMLALGCVDALHLDGGNSATFGGIREGGEKFELINTPSGNVERAVSNTLMIVSTAVSDGTFDHSVISGKYNYFVPNSVCTFEAAGIDATGRPAEIPADVFWRLSDDSFGNVENGTFTSNGKTGDVDIQMIYNDKVVGSKTVHIVNPTKISFDAEEKTIPYGKTSELKITAMYNQNEIYCTSDAFTINIEVEGAGTLDGFNFTATTDETLSNTAVTAKYKYDESLGEISVNVNFGKGSEVLFDFEDKDVSDWIGVDKVGAWIDEENKKYTDSKYQILTLEKNSNGNGTKSSSTFAATKENGGQVKNGTSSLGLTFNRVHDKDVGGWSYNYMFYVGDTQVWRDVANGKNATKLGMWMYLPKEAAGLYARICRTFTKDDSGKLYTNYDYFTVDGTKFSEFKNIPESGWVYAEFDLTNYDYQSSLQFNPEEDYAMNNGKTANSNYYPAFIQFFVNTYDMEAEEITIYIDDITLDYSDVTEDRDAPVISNAVVSASVDNFETLNGQTLNSNSLSFAADIAEVTGTNNYTGLDYSKAKIYIDGMDMSSLKNFKAAGNTLALSDVYVIDGEHEIVFEIADKQNNYTKLTKTFCVDGKKGTPVIRITGHNEGNDIPKAGSLYYLDIIASDAGKVKSLETTLKLQTANIFEYDHMITAAGVDVTYEYQKLNNELSLKIDNHSETEGENILVSIPIRVWSWDEEKTGITAASQWATSNSPIVKIQCETTIGQVTFTDDVALEEYITGFYGSIDVATEVDDKTKWHEHTVITLEDSAATCTEEGYKDRTYCEGCRSIIDWGTSLEAGHNYQMNEENILCCQICEARYSGTYEGKEYMDGLVSSGWIGDSFYREGIKLTGVQKVTAPDSAEEYYYDFGENGICTGKVKYTGIFHDADADLYRYSKLGKLSSGWMLIDEAWYYFDNVTMAGVSGKVKLGAVTYEFENNGKLLAGVWADTLFGTRYYYGPSYYKNGWYNIDGKDYCFEDGYRIENGWQLVFESQRYLNWYYFNEDGSCDRNIKPEDGFYEYRLGYGYARDGKGLSGLQFIDDKCYYFHDKGYALKNGTFGGRLFKDDYEAYTGLVEKEGTLYYFVNGTTATCGLYKYEGAYYYSYWGGIVKTDGRYYVDTSYCDLPAGNYTFGEDGKMLNGVVEKDGITYLYINGTQASCGLYKVNDAYYYSYWGGVLKTDGKYYVDTTYCDLPVGNYEFGPDGKMLDGVIKKDDVLYLYQKGKTATCGLYKVDGDYYYSYWGGVLRTDGRYYVDTTFCDLPSGNYSFDENGRMLNGIVEKDGVLYLYQNGTTATEGMYEVDGQYYYSYWGGIVKTGKQYVGTSFCKLPAGNYEFDASGKMMDGVVEKDGVLYLYQNGKTATYGLYKLGNDYYYSYWGGVIKTGKQYVGTTYCDLPIGNYEFGEDGKMLDGIVDKDGVSYLYQNGKTATYGLYKLGDDYYYSYWGGVVKTGKQYVGTTYCDLPIGNYEFGEDGKMLNGFVERDGEIYYYVNGKTPAPGLIEIDGNYYFVNWGGILVRNCVYYVWETNGLSIECNYTFDETGRVIK